MPRPAAVRRSIVSVPEGKLGTIMGRVDGKIALVTGAARGLGQAMAGLLAAEGARVLLTDIDADEAAVAAAAINEDHDGRARSMSQDVTRTDDWQSVLERVQNDFGGLHVLINNAGIGSVANIEEESLENWRQVHSVDLDAVFIGCKLAIPLMAASGGGSIVNVSSVSGIIAGHNLAAYNSAKAAVRHLSKSIALHCARVGNGIRCNSIHPAFIDTPILDGLAGAVSRDETVAGRQFALSWRDPWRLEWGALDPGLPS